MARPVPGPCAEPPAEPSRRDRRRTLEAGTGTESIRLAEEHRPDLILPDIQLPDLGGEAVLGRLLADPTTAAIPLAALAAQAMAGDRERLLGLAFDGYLTKPISVRGFPEQVRRFCERAG